MISKDKELIRINTAKNTIEYSHNAGRSWLHRYNPISSVGELEDLMDNGREILLTTNKGLFYSTNEGRSWLKRK